MKPFNPILGETLQCRMNDGTEIYCEHTSHHPPVSNFYMHPKEKEYEFWGFYEFTANMSSNSMRAGQKGPNNIRFSDGQHIRYSLMDYRLGGTAYGDRTIEGTGNMVFEDLTNHVKAVIVFNTYKKSGWFRTTETGRKDEFVGVIYRTLHPIDPQESFKNHYSKNFTEIRELSKLDKEIGEKVATLEGSWLRNIKIDGQEYWNID